MDKYKEIESLTGVVSLVRIQRDTFAVVLDYCFTIQDLEEILSKLKSIQEEWNNESS